MAHRRQQPLSATEAGVNAPLPAGRTTRFQQAMALLLILLQVPHSLYAQNLSFEYAVKATYLYKFAPFVAWPNAAFSEAGSPFNICIAGQDPFGAALDQAVSGERIDTHPIVVRRLEESATDLQCHVLYAGRPLRQRGTDWLARSKGKPVLTITDESQGVPGGIIHFVIVDGRVRFRVDTIEAGSSGLTVSSKLLSLAVSIRRPT